jgi:hypothetical protein
MISIDMVWVSYHTLRVKREGYIMYVSPIQPNLGSLRHVTIPKKIEDSAAKR